MGAKERWKGQEVGGGLVGGMRGWVRCTCMEYVSSSTSHSSEWWGFTLWAHFRVCRSSQSVISTSNINEKSSQQFICCSAIVAGATESHTLAVSSLAQLYKKP